ncbi:MAG: hypothetical protein IPG99_13990 [Ignavibacteria bacterium]|nr:hypothetical protein [Ignavibacteria bacterium]
MRIKICDRIGSQRCHGRSAPEEFMVPSPVGEDNIVYSEDGKYSSNIEVAVSFKEGVKRLESDLPLKISHTQY